MSEEQLEQLEMIMEGMELDDGFADDHDAPPADEAGSDSCQDSEYDREMYGMYQALPVPDGEPDWDAGEATTVEEYLKRVRWEAAQLPMVTTSSIDPAAYEDKKTSYLKLPEPIPDAPAWALPQNQWLLQFVDDFERFRKTLHRLDSEQGAASSSGIPHPNDLQAWDRVCFGPPEGGPGPPATEVDLAVLPQLVLQTVMAMDQVTVAELLRRHVSLMDPLPSLPATRAQWLFALLARLDKPIHADTGAALRALLRKCCVLRAGLAGPADQQLVPLNTLIAVSGCYFAQDEQLACRVDRDLF